MTETVAVRFAPSPTGPLHIGGIRTALYDYLFARKYGGRCILRIEDTDQTRFVEGAEAYIKESLEWMGITFTEGPGIGGDYGPYRQSERKEIYRKYVDQLLTSKHAYYAFDTPKELDAMREQLKEAGHKSLQYNYLSRNRMKNSLTLSEEEVQSLLEQGVPYVVRMKMPRNEEIRFHDVVRNWVVFHSSQLDDKILLKSDGMPTYHMANVVDDHLMKITHVIRGEEWLSSTPLHVLLYRALGWEDSMPEFVHLPLILNPNGVGKMSKRQGDKLGFSVFPLNWTDPETGKLSTGYREDGYLAEAMLNFLALQGWSPGNDEELMSEERLIELFELERVNSSATQFDLDKLKWFNQQYIKHSSPEKLLPFVKAAFISAGKEVEEDQYLLKVIKLLQERVTVISDFVVQSDYLFQTPTSYDEKMRKKRWNNDAKELMLALKDKFSITEDWNAERLEDAFEQLVKEKEVGKGKILAPMRLVLTGLPAGPGAFDIAELIGKEETLHRIDKAVAELAT